MSDILKHYEKYNQEGGHYFLEWFKGSSRPLMIQNWLDTNLKPGSKVLDLGCGDGSLAEWMPHYEWTGLDIGEPKKAYKGTWVKQDLEATPYNLVPESFDAVVCSEVLEHLFSPEKVNLEAARLLKRGGVYIISTPNFDWIEHKDKDYRQVVYDPRNEASHTREHIRFYTIDTHATMLRNAGFKLLDFMGADPQWGEFFQRARWELKQATGKTDGEVDILLGKMFPDRMHTIGALSVRT